MRHLLTAGLAVALLALAAASAQAATVTKDAGFITFTAGAGETNDLRITDDGDAYRFTDAPTVAVEPGAGCQEDELPDEPNVVVCPKGSTTLIITDLLDGDDEVTPEQIEFIGLFERGGEGADTLRGSDRSATSTLIGGPGTDVYETPGFQYDAISYSDKTAGLTASMDDVANDPDGENVPSNADALAGGSGNDTLTGSGTGEYLYGGPGADTLNGGDGPDNLTGEAGNDIVNGDAGTDTVGGGTGDDRVNGDAGTDFVFFDAGNDVISGGSEFDRVTAYVTAYDNSTTRADVRVTLDGQANDGQAGESDQVLSDVEDVSVQGNSFYFGRATVTGDERFNVIAGYLGDDTLDGGDGGDDLRGFGGDDTINADEGVRDRVDCGPGNDTANVDALDDVANCETVNRSTRNATAGDDRPPTVAFSAPAPNARVGTRAAIAVDAADDRGVSRVVLMDDDRVVGTDTEAPYRFDYEPTGGDVGRDTLTAVAVDTSEQTGTAQRVVQVDRFRPGIRGRVTPARDRRAPYRFRVTGGVQLPRVVTAAQACTTGFVSVQVKRGTRTISTRRVRIRRTCGFSSTVTFRSRRRLGTGRLSVTVRWLGNAVLAPRTSQRVRVRAG